MTLSVTVDCSAVVNVALPDRSACAVAVMLPSLVTVVTVPPWLYEVES